MNKIKYTISDYICSVLAVCNVHAIASGCPRALTRGYTLVATGLCGCVACKCTAMPTQALPHSNHGCRRCTVAPRLQAHGFGRCPTTVRQYSNYCCHFGGCCDGCIAGAMAIATLLLLSWLLLSLLLLPPQREGRAQGEKGVLQLRRNGAPKRRTETSRSGASIRRSCSSN